MDYRETIKRKRHGQGHHRVFLLDAEGSQQVIEATTFRLRRTPSGDVFVKQALREEANILEAPGEIDEAKVRCAI